MHKKDAIYLDQFCKKKSIRKKGYKKYKNTFIKRIIKIIY